MIKPDKFPQWCMTKKENMAEYPQSKIDGGWDIGEIPPREWENYSKNLSCLWIQYLEEKENELSKKTSEFEDKFVSIESDIKMINDEIKTINDKILNYDNIINGLTKWLNQGFAAQLDEGSFNHFDPNKPDQDFLKKTIFSNKTKKEG